MKLNFHFVINLVMKNLNEGENYGQHFKRRKHHQNSRVWIKKGFQLERCGIALFAEGQENQWYIGSGCSKHMTCDKEKLHSYNSLEIEKNVSFGNDTTTIIKGKGFVYLK